MSDQDLLEKEDAAVLDDTAKDFSPEEQAEYGKLATNDPEAADDQVGEGFKKEKPVGRFRNASSNLSTYRKLGITMGVAGILVAAGIAIFSFLIPFKLTHIVETIEQRVGNVPGYAVENRLEFYMSRYLMIRSLEATGQFDFSEGGADRDKFTYLGDGFWNTMYTNWKGAKLEEKLVTQHGIKVSSTVDNEIFRRNTKMRADHFKIEQLGAGRESPLREQTLNRTEVRDFIKTFAREETKSRQVFKRYNMRKVMKNYFGVGNWKPFERQRDEVSNKYYEKKRAFQKRLVNETVGRLSERYGNYMECLLGASSSKACRDILKKADPSASLPDAEKDKDGTNAAEADIDAANPDAVDIDTPGSGSGESELSKGIMEKLQDFGLKKTLATLVTGVGVIANLIHIYDTVDSGVINQVIYDKNAQQYLAYSAPLLSAADQIRSGEDFDLEDVRVAQEVFDDFDESPVYQAGTSSAGTVSAQATVSRDCNDDSSDGNETTLEPGETVCPHKRLIQDKTKFTDSAAWRAFGSILTPFRPVGGIVDVVSGVVSSVMNALGVNSAIQSIMNLLNIDQAAAKTFGFLLNILSGPVISGAETGGNAFDSLYAAVAVQQSSVGGDVGISKEDTIGGAYLSDAQVAAIREEQMDEYFEELGNKSFFARYFSPSVKESLTGQLALHMPSSAGTAGQELATTLSNPARMFSSLGKLFSTRVGAQTVPETNPFHVLNMGFPIDHEIFTANGGEGMDYEQIAGKYQCDRPVGERDQNKQFGNVNGTLPFEVPTAVDPCLLEQAVLDASTRYFTGTFDEGISGVTTAPVTGSSNETSVVGNTANVPCAAGTTDVGEVDGYSDGQKYRIRLCEIPGFVSESQEDPNHLVQINSTASGKWLQLFQQAKAAGITLKAKGSFRTMERQQYFYNCMITGSCNSGNEAAKPGYSNHQIGFAVDVDIAPGSDPSLTTCQASPDTYPVYKVLAAHGPPLGIEAKVRSECWHWSVGGN